MGRRSWGKRDFRDLTVEELSHLLYLSYTDSREHQRDYLVSLVGFLTYPDLDYMLSVGGRLIDCVLLPFIAILFSHLRVVNGGEIASHVCGIGVGKRMPMQVLRGFTFFFSRLTLFSQLGLRAFPLRDIG